MHEGHRKRMLERAKRDLQGLQDHELLEILLFYSIPRHNTNPIAHEALDSFGSIERMFAANMEKFREVDGIGDGTALYLAVVGEVARRSNRTAENPPQIYNTYSFTRFLSSRFAGMDTEVVELYCLDERKSVSFIKQFISQSKDHAKVSSQDIIEVFTSQKPHGLVVAHNHPNASSKPSAEDDRFTAELQLLCSMHGVSFYDHVVVGTDEPYSYFYVGRLDAIKDNFHYQSVSGRKDLF